MSDRELAIIISRALIAIAAGIQKRYGLPVYRNVDIVLQEKTEDVAPPLKYWQHGETGRVCESVLQPSREWYMIKKSQYEIITGAMKNAEPVTFPSVAKVE